MTKMQQQTKSQNIENRFEYDGSTRQIFGIWIINILLGVITLGIYSFWGRTRMRKYVANGFSLLKDRFEYNGTGGELFRGFLKALLVIVPIYSPYFIWDQSPWVSLALVPIIYFIFIATHSALRYRLSRTTWRGIRGKLTGSAFDFALKNMIRGILNIITLGLLIPSSDIKIYKIIIDNTHFGNAKFNFVGTSKELFSINLMTILLAVPTVGLSRFWYSAALTRHKCANTVINALHCRATHTGGSLLLLHAVNMLIIIFTLGIGIPIVTQRNLKYFSEHVFIVGDINAADILQSDEKLGSSGEGIDVMLDLGLM